MQKLLDNPNLFKNWILLLGLTTLLFCFFLDTAKSIFEPNGSSVYYTFSGKQHTDTNVGDCYLKIYSCSDDLCTIASATPFLGGFALGIGVLVFILQIFVEQLLRFITAAVNRLLQYIFLFLTLGLELTIPILYLSSKSQYWSLCWFPLFLEFFSVLAVILAIFLFIKGDRQQQAIILQQ